MSYGSPGHTQVVWATSAHEVAGLLSMLRVDCFQVPLAIFVQITEPRCIERFIAFCQAGIANRVAFRHLEVDLWLLSASSKTIMPILDAMLGLSVHDLDVRVPTGRTRAFSLPLMLAACCRVHDLYSLKLTGTTMGTTFPREWPTSSTRALHLDIKMETASWERLLGLMSFPALLDIEIHDNLPGAATHDFLARHQKTLSYITLHGSAQHVEKSIFHEILSLGMLDTLQVTVSFAALLLGRATACKAGSLALICDEVTDPAQCTQVWDYVREIASLNVLSVPIDSPLAFHWPLDGQEISPSVSVLEVVACGSVDCTARSQLTSIHLVRNAGH